MNQVEKSRNGDFSSRLKAVMEKRGMDRSAVAQLMDVSWSSVDRWFQGSIPHRATLERLSVVLSASPRWLRTGVGGMDLTEEEDALRESRRNGGTRIEENQQRVREEPGMAQIMEVLDAGFKFTPKEFAAYQELRTLREDFERRLNVMILDRAEDGHARFIARIEEYRRTCEELSPEACTHIYRYFKDISKAKHY